MYTNWEYIEYIYGIIKDEYSFKTYNETPSGNSSHRINPFIDMKLDLYFAIKNKHLSKAERIVMVFVESFYWLPKPEDYKRMMNNATKRQENKRTRRSKRYDNSIYYRKNK